MEIRSISIFSTKCLCQKFNARCPCKTNQNENYENRVEKTYMENVHGEKSHDLKKDAGTKLSIKAVS